jgi:hypothetical protein
MDWISTGPKSNCYTRKTNTGEVVCKIKRFTLNYETSEKINSDRINNILEKSSRAGPESKTNKDCKINTQYHRITSWFSL